LHVVAGGEPEEVPARDETRGGGQRLARQQRPLLPVTLQKGTRGETGEQRA